MAQSKVKEPLRAGDVRSILEDISEDTLRCLHDVWDEPNRSSRAMFVAALYQLLVSYDEKYKSRLLVDAKLILEVLDGKSA